MSVLSTRLKVAENTVTQVEEKSSDNLKGAERRMSARSQAIANAQTVAHQEVIYTVFIYSIYIGVYYIHTRYLYTWYLQTVLCAGDGHPRSDLPAPRCIQRTRNMCGSHTPDEPVLESDADSHNSCIHSDQQKMNTAMLLLLHACYIQKTGKCPIK